MAWPLRTEHSPAGTRVSETDTHSRRRRPAAGSIDRWLDTLISMPIALWALLWFGVATIWVEGRWAVSVLEAGTFLLTAVTVLRNRSRAIPHWTVVCLASVAAWGLAQIALRWTVAPAQTEWAILYWLAAAGLAALGALIRDREYFLNGLLWFGVLSALALARNLHQQWPDSVVDPDPRTGPYFWHISQPQPLRCIH